MTADNLPLCERLTLVRLRVAGVRRKAMMFGLDGALDDVVALLAELVAHVQAIEDSCKCQRHEKSL